MARPQIRRTFAVGNRMITVTAYDQVGPEDCYTMLLQSVLHRYVTGEDVTPAIGRDVKDAIIKPYAEG